jgi:hypothetical protein
LPYPLPDRSAQTLAMMKMAFTGELDDVLDTVAANCRYV